MSAQSHKEVVITDNIRSISGTTNIEDKIEYGDGRLLNDIGNNELVSKQMLSGAIAAPYTYTANVGDAWPVVLTNGIDFTTTRNFVKVTQLLESGATQRSNNGAGTIYKINYSSSTKLIITTIEVETATVNFTTVSDKTLIIIE